VFRDWNATRRVDAEFERSLFDLLWVTGPDFTRHTFYPLHGELRLESEFDYSLGDWRPQISL
jgi:hypothetical protein